MNRRIMWLSLFTLGCIAPMPVIAQGKIGVAKEAAEFVLGKFGKDVTKEGVETLTRQIDSVMLKFGDEGLAAVKNVGPRSFKLIEEAGENSDTAVKLMAKYGDDAVRIVGKPSRLACVVRNGDEAAQAMMTHGQIAEPLIDKFGQTAAVALNKVSPQNARRMSMLNESGEIAAIGRSQEVLGVVGKYGDAAMDFIWKHKEPLMVVSALTAFLANPEPFIQGTSDLAAVVGDSLVRPIAQEVGRQTNWTIVVLGMVAVCGGLFALRYWVNHRTNS